MPHDVTEIAPPGLTPQDRVWWAVPEDPGRAQLRHILVMPAWWREAHPEVPGAIELDFGLPNPGNLRHEGYPRWYIEAWRTTYNGLAASG